MKSIRAFAIPVALIVIWEAIFRFRDVQSDTLSTPSRIVVALVQGLGDGSMLTATGDTLAAGGLGLLLGSVLGVVVGTLFGLVPVVSRGLRLTFELLRPIPAIAIVPVAILIFGFGYAMETAIVAFACFFPVTILAEAAIRQVPPRLSEVSRALQMPLAARLFKILLPAALPRLFVALRLAVGIALIVAVTVEIAANPMGLGQRLMLAGSSLRPADMFATLIWVGLLGWVLNLGLVKAQHVLFPRMAGSSDAAT
ncbi:MAG: ABC transporter permease subunit [Pseudomonadota bacterium]|nr:ABC transporter permease subunit [Pseudomonadota bacterium]